MGYCLCWETWLIQGVQCCFQLELWFLKRVSGTRVKISLTSQTHFREKRELVKIYNAHKPPGWRRGADAGSLVLVSVEAMVSETVHGWQEIREILDSVS